MKPKVSRSYGSTLMSKYNTIISSFKKKHILVIGDVILDQYIKGSVSRLSPEAPVPVVLQQESFYTPGGAANVAHNLTALDAKVTLIGRVGNDGEGDILRRELEKKGVSAKSIFTDSTIPTAAKTRVLAQHHQVVRIDREKITALSNKKLIQRIFDFLKKNIKTVDAIIISDYGKGMITPELVEFTCSLALKEKKIITIDPKAEHFMYYKRVTSITPNKSETENAIRNIKIKSDNGSNLEIDDDKLKTDKDIDRAGEQLLKFLNLDSILITLGEHGMRLFERGKKPLSIKTQARDVFDVTGAGDAVISVFTLALTAGASKSQAAELSNFAAGIVVGKLGAVAVTKDELVEACKRGQVLKPAQFSKI